MFRRKKTQTNQTNERSAIEMGNVDTNMIGNGIEMLNNVSKFAANMSTPKNQEKKSYKEGDNLNQPHNQTVEVKLGNDQPNKPVVVHEKKETHIHKPFPEGRELSERECEVEKLRLQLEYDAKKDNLAYRVQMEEARRKERREADEYARKERERRHEENRKATRKLWIAAGVGFAGLVGLAAYNIYTSSRVPGGSGFSIQQPQTGVNAIPAEGTVK